MDKYILLGTREKKKIFCLFEQDCVDNAILTRAADDTGFTEIGCDNCALGHQVPTNIVRVCCIFCNRVDLDLLNLSGLLVANVCVFAAECADLGVTTGYSDGLYTGFSNGGISRGSADLKPLFATVGMVTATGGLSY